MQTVVVAMSGGVDSSVSALLLKRLGLRVIGLFMHNWDEKEDGVCRASLEYEDVQRVCDQLQIPHYAVNFTKEYQESVFAHFLKEYEAGSTPNPDILCNKEIKFKCLLDQALALQADYLATGHYCQIAEMDGKKALARGTDPTKDQSYFLYTLKSSVLERVLFPVGNLEKKEVRRIAKEANLATCNKKDSTGICFIGKRNFKHFLSSYLPIRPGNFETPEGKVVGRHDGIAYYTIGQRKGLKIGGPGKPWFVVDKDPARNKVIVVQGEDHPDLYGNCLLATEATWVVETPTFPLFCTAQIRYRQRETPCVVEERGGKLLVFFPHPQKAITPRQSIVFYQQDLCLGGAIIETKYADRLDYNLYEDHCTVSRG